MIFERARVDEHLEAKILGEVAWEFRDESQS